MGQASRVAFWLAAVALSAHAASYTVGYQKSVTIPMPGATAAYALDPAIAEASATQGVLTLSGYGPGTTHVVVIAPQGVVTLEVVVPIPPTIYPKGWVMPRSDETSNEAGFDEMRYSSLPQQWSNTIDFTRQGSDLSTHFHAVVTKLFSTASASFTTSDNSSFAINSLFYQFKTKRRTVTLLDEMVRESPLTVDNATVRGLHWQEGNWFFHGGYTSPSSFQNVFLPVMREGVFGAGYRYHLSTHSWLTPSLYYLTVPRLDSAGKAGGIFSLLYRYQPREDFRLDLELGVSRGVAGALDLSYKGTRDELRAVVRYSPTNFARLGTSNIRGTTSNVSWARKWTEKWSGTFNFAGNRFDLSGLREDMVNAVLQERYAATRHWSLFGGVGYSLFRADLAGQHALKGLSSPLGLTFNSKYFGATIQQQYSRYADQNTGGRQWGASVQSGWGQLGFSGYAQRETQAPTVSFLLTQVPQLGQAMALAGLTATTPQDIAAFLQDNALLISLHYLQNVKINVVPVREQVSGSVSWRSTGRQPEVDYQFLYNNDQTITNSVQSVIHRVTAIQRLGRSNDLSVAFAQYRSKVPGQGSEARMIFTVTLRHQFASAPPILTWVRHGTIRGKVFRDEEGTGKSAASGSGFAGVEICLDQRRRTRTASDGSYRFTGVPEGRHQVQAALPKGKSYYFTTAEQAEVGIGAEVEFGIAASQASLLVQVLDDSQRGVADLPVTVEGGVRKFAAASSAGGRLLLPQVEAGSYDVSIDPDTLPAGYVLGDPAAAHVILSPASPGKVVLGVRALRSVGGQVLVYDTKVLREVGLAGAEVVLPGLSRRSVTDAQGRYLFRNLPSGAFTISATSGGRTITRAIAIPDEPSQQNNLNLVIGQR